MDCKHVQTSAMEITKLLNTLATVMSPSCVGCLKNTLENGCTGAGGNRSKIDGSCFHRDPLASTGEGRRGRYFLKQALLGL